MASDVPSPGEFEKLGVFYLGRGYDLEAKAPTDALMLYDSRHLVTHALCVGMTGSGKTGLCLALLEEAALDGIPAIVIDPKGDLSNLLLTFPELRPEDFRPYVDEGEATRKGTTPDALAAEVAVSWKQGLATWGEDGARIAKFRESCEVVVYTPGSSTGVQLSLLGSFAAPAAALVEDAEAFAGLIEGSASGLLALAGVDAELRSREHVLLSQIFSAAWSQGQGLDLAALVQTIQKPSFDRVGALDLETFYPAKDRSALALAINALLASPAAATWARGEPLDPASLLRSPSGKPRIAVLSIAHLSDAQRMFFVTTLLDSVIGWMRRQSGTSSLRALLYMDEIFGYFPPTAAPPSKRPMLTLLKQARAYGLGVVLATQNPVDLDYKGLANCGTWFLGRLQAERDKLRVLDGLEGASASLGQGLDRQTMDRVLSGLANRVFFCHDVHGGGGVFQSRHTLSYLRGPLTREQLAALSKGKNAATSTSTAAVASTAKTESNAARPAIPGDIAEAFFPVRGPSGQGVAINYRPGILAVAKLHYVQAKSEVDHWQPLAMVAPFEGGDVTWEHATLIAPAFAAAALSEPIASPGVTFEMPPGVTSKKFATWQKQLATHVYQSRPLVLYACESQGMVSKPGESVQDFQGRLAHGTRESRDERIAAVDKKYRPKFEALGEKLRKAQAKIAKEQADVQSQQVGTAVTFGTSVLGAVFGRGMMTGANANRAGSVVRGAQRIGKEKDDVARATADEQAIRDKWTELQNEANAELQRVQAEVHDAAAAVTELTIAPRKSDVSIERFALAWVPFRASPSGTWEPAW